MEYRGVELHHLGPAFVVWDTDSGVHRQGFDPGADLAELPQEAQDEINAHWTPEAIAAWEAMIAANELPAPDPEPAEPKVEIAASGLFSFDEAGEVTNVKVPKNLSAWRFDVGQVLCFFATPMETADYMALAYDTGTCRAFVEETSKEGWGFMVSIVDLNGDPVDPATISVEVKRAIS